MNSKTSVQQIKNRGSTHSFRDSVAAKENNTQGQPLKRVLQLYQVPGEEGTKELVRVGSRNVGTTGEKTSTAVKLIDY